MKFVPSIHSNSLKHSLYRAVLAAQSVVMPSPAVLAKGAVIGNGTATAPQFPATVAVGAVPGVAGWHDAFKAVGMGDGTLVTCEIPYSPRIYAKTLSLKAAIIDVTTTAMIVPTIKPLVTPVALATLPKSLEEYIYDQMLLLTANMVINGGMGIRPVIRCEIMLNDTVNQLLIDPTDIGSMVP